MEFYFGTPKLVHYSEVIWRLFLLCLLFRGSIKPPLQFCNTSCRLERGRYISQLLSCCVNPCSSCMFKRGNWCFFDRLFASNGMQQNRKVVSLLGSIGLASFAFYCHSLTTHFITTTLSSLPYCASWCIQCTLRIVDILRTQLFVLCRAVVLFRRLFGMGTFRLSFIGGFTLADT